MLTKLRQMICRHEWRMSKFQALVPGIDQICTKCGKRRHIDSSR